MVSSGPFRAIRFPYPGPFNDIGFWGEPTATLNWCEEDYVLSYYCAELCNTITNLTFLYLGFRGVRSCLFQSHDRIFLISFCGYILVGLGSIAFHASLKYPMQLWDELSMIYTTCLMLFASFSYARSVVFSSVLGIGLLALSAFISIYYHMTKDPEFHQAAYGILTAIVVLHGMWVMESRLRPALRARHGEKGDRILKTSWAMVATGLCVFLCGFLVWNLDNIYCNQIRRWRREIGLPWAILLEGHGWWHLMTGLGGNYSAFHAFPLWHMLTPIAYYYIVWGVWLRRCLGAEDMEYVLHWPATFTSLPEVRRVGNRPFMEKKVQ